MTINISPKKEIRLLPPLVKDGIPLMQAIFQRETSRAFSDSDLSLQDLSNLLWVANGYNRRDKRTIPTTRNKQEIDVYAVMKSGTYLYIPETSTLEQVLEKDIRTSTGEQPFLEIAPLNLIYVANLSKIDSGPNIDKKVVAACDVGHASQNVYLYAASFGLSVTVRDWFDRNKISNLLKLKMNQHISLIHTIGYPR